MGRLVPGALMIAALLLPEPSIAMQVGEKSFGPENKSLQLLFPVEKQERITLPNGSEVYIPYGTVTNVGDVLRDLPPLLILLRDAEERVVYSWTIVPPKSSLKPGESVTIDEPVTDIPKSAKFAEIGWKPD